MWGWGWVVARCSVDRVIYVARFVVVRVETLAITPMSLDCALSRRSNEEGASKVPPPEYIRPKYSGREGPKKQSTLKSPFKSALFLNFITDRRSSAIAGAFAAVAVSVV